MPVVYYVRHGETDWNLEFRLQGHRDVDINARGRRQAAHCGVVLRDLLAKLGRMPADLGYVSSPLLRARATMELMRATLGLDPSDYRIDDKLIEISFGEWEGLTLADVTARAPAALVHRGRDKWGFLPPGGESYRDVARRVGAWHASITRDTVVAAHGGVARALIAHLGILPGEEAAHMEIEHGVVYVFAAVTMTRFA
jgi:probable phosphoglycerate mutase